MLNFLSNILNYYYQATNKLNCIKKYNKVVPTPQIKQVHNLA